MPVTWPEDRKPPRLPPGKRWNLHAGQVRQQHVAPRSEPIAEGTMRDYQRIPGPCVLVVVAPRIKAGQTKLGWQVSTERRGPGGHAGRVLAVPCDTLAEVVATMCVIAKRVTLAPPDHLHITLADELDAGVRHYCGLVLLAAMSHAPHDGDVVAA